MDLDLDAVLAELAAGRPVFHSKRDFQHALAWQIQSRHPAAQVRLEPRPRRAVHLDMLVRLGGRWTAVELKYLLSRFNGAVDGEAFDLPNQSAQDISRHDVVKDVVRVETLIGEGYAERGFVIVLTNDATYWRPSARATTIDAAFRIHEGRALEGTLSWAWRVQYPREVSCADSRAASEEVNSWDVIGLENIG